MEYFKSLLCASALVSVASAFAPLREGIRRAVLCALSVIFLLFILPMGKGVDFSSFFSFDSAEGENTHSSEVYAEAWKEGIEEGILRDLCDRYSLARDRIEIESEIIMEEDQVTVSYLSLTLYGTNAAADASGMVRYIEKTYGCRSEIHLRAA